MKKSLLLISVLMSVIANGKEKEVVVEKYKLGTGKPVLMVIAGMHGNERSGIELMLNKREYDFKDGTMIILPEVNREASKNNKRRADDGEDLNRVFGVEKSSYSFKLAKQIEKIIKEEKPDIILDLHESRNPNNGTDAQFYLGNSLIFTPETFDKISDLILESDLSMISNAPKGSMNRYISSTYKIPTITVETAQTESVNERQDRYLKFINQSLEYLKMK